MSSNGQHSASESVIATPESIATAMESINTLAVWLREAGLDERAISLRLVRFAQSLILSSMR